MVAFKVPSVTGQEVTAPVATGQAPAAGPLRTSAIPSDAAAIEGHRRDMRPRAAAPETTGQAAPGGAPATPVGQHHRSGPTLALNGMRNMNLANIEAQRQMIFQGENQISQEISGMISQEQTVSESAIRLTATAVKQGFAAGGQILRAGQGNGATEVLQTPGVPGRPSIPDPGTPIGTSAAPVVPQTTGAAPSPDVIQARLAKLVAQMGGRDGADLAQWQMVREYAAQQIALNTPPSDVAAPQTTGAKGATPAKKAPTVAPPKKFTVPGVAAESAGALVQFGIDVGPQLAIWEMVRDNADRQVALSSGRLVNQIESSISQMEQKRISELSQRETAAGRFQSDYVRFDVMNRYNQDRGSFLAIVGAAFTPGTGTKPDGVEAAAYFGLIGKEAYAAAHFYDEGGIFHQHIMDTAAYLRPNAAGVTQYYNPVQPGFQILEGVQEGVKDAFSGQHVPREVGQLEPVMPGQNVPAPSPRMKQGIQPALPTAPSDRIEDLVESGPAAAD